MKETQKNIFSDGLSQFIKGLEEISKTDNIELLNADFETKNITLRILSLGSSAEDVIKSINLCRITDKMVIKSANFSTGEITVLWTTPGFARLNNLGLSTSEIDALKHGQIIAAIKSYRARNSVGLAEAKVVIDHALQILK